MGVYTNTDILVSASGDLAIGSNGDFQMATPSGVLIQDMAFRARTDWDDFEPHPKLGANLQELIGEPNDRYTGGKAEDMLRSSFTQGNMIYPLDLRVKAVPISNEKIALYGFVDATNYKSNVFHVAIFDYGDGIINALGGEEDVI